MKKVLYIAYYWPPSGGVNVIRNIKFVKYLRDFGWEPIIFAPENPSYPFIDEKIGEELPEHIEIIKGPILEPLSLFKKISGRKKSDPLQDITGSTSSKKTWIDELSIWIRGNFFIPDARFLWIKPSVKYLTEYLKNNKIDAIITSGPPHSSTVIGLKLANKFKIPWMADFQDPWTQVDYYKLMKIGNRADRKHRKLEQEVFKNANKIAIVSPSWKEDLESIGAKDVGVLFYGYDESDFQNYKRVESPYFKIFHAGLLGHDRNIASFIQVVKEIIDEFPEYRKIIRFEFAGEVDFSNKENFRKYGLIDITTFYGMIPRSEVFKHYNSAQLLILPINQADNAKGRIPGKLFECLRTQIPMLVFGPDDGDVRNLVVGKNAGISVPYENSHDQQKAYLLSLLEKFQKGESTLNVSDVSELSNYEQTRKLAGYLDSII